MQWFKIHHGFTSNRKFGLIANQLDIPRAEVIAIALDVIEYASRQEERGSVAGYDIEGAAYALDLSDTIVSNALLALRNRGFCNEHVVLNWDEYQGRSDATNADRQRRYRDKKKQEVIEEVTPVTDSNALRNTDKIRIDKKREEKESNFTAFWNLYPKKEGKKNAKAKYLKALDKTPHEKIMSGLESYRKCEKVVKGFIMNPETWINGEHWNDEYAGGNKPKSWDDDIYAGVKL